MVPTRVRLASPRFAALAAPLALGLSACGPQDQPMPGTGLGTFALTAKLATNTCGAGTKAPDPWTFDVALSRDGSTLYWRQSGAQVSGTLDGAGNATIAGSMSGAGAGPDGKATSCTMTRADSISVALGAAAQPTSFTGTIGFRFTADGSPECSLQLSAYGGSYDALPCETGYSFTATRTKAP